MPFKKNQIPWNKTNTNIICKICKKVVHISPSRLKDKKIKRGLFCSKICKNKSRIGIPSWNKNIKGNEYKKHYKMGFGGIFYKSERVFKGTKKEYFSLHYFIRKTLGKPSECEICKGKFYGKKIQWANKSGQYRKDISDWLRLCVKCHFFYDKQSKRKNKKLEDTSKS